MRTDAIHGLLKGEELIAGTVQRSQSGAACVDESLVDVEKEQFHSLTTNQFFLGFKQLLRKSRFHLQFEPAVGIEANKAIREGGVCHFVFAGADWTNHHDLLSSYMSTSTSIVNEIRREP
jgi:hypothetical protein